jgi:MFS family permease
MSATTGSPPHTAPAPSPAAAPTDGAGAGVDARLRRRLLPLHVAVLLQGVNLWVPVEKLFMEEIGFDPAGVGLMAAAYAAVVPALEVPSGILADRWSRRGVLTLATVALLVSSLIGGLSNDVTTYIAGAMFLGVFFALQSGTLDAVVYDTVLEEAGDGAGFERRIGRVRVLESASLVGSALAGGALASVVGTRALFFLTLPFLVASVVALRAFDEPRLHRDGSSASLRDHVTTTYRTLTRRGALLPLVAVMVLLGVLINLLFEFGPLWLVALSAPAVIYGPHFAGLGTSFGLAGLAAGRVRLGDPAAIGAVVAATLGASAVLLTVRDAVVVTLAQVVIVVLSVLLTIVLTARLHDAVPSTIRSSVASGVGTFTWIAFLPTSLLFGQATKSLGVYAAAWIVAGIAAVAGVLTLRLSVAVRRETPAAPAAAPAAPAAVPVPAAVSPAAAPAPAPAPAGAVPCADGPGSDGPWPCVEGAAA